MAEHNDRTEKYGTPKPYKGDLGNNGYPNNVKSTQTLKIRGTGAATKGTKSSTKMG